MRGEIICRWKTGLAALMVLGLVSCAPEQSSHVLPQEVVGLEPVEQWSDSNWKVKLPKGWIVEPVFGMRDASFRIIGEAGAEAEVSFSRLPVQGGTLASNVNRWRVQAGLEPWQEDQVKSQLTKISISNHDAYQMKFVAPEAAGQSIYGIMMEEGKDRVFIKFSGPAYLMEGQQEAWDFFVENLEIHHAH